MVAEGARRRIAASSAAETKAGTRKTSSSSFRPGTVVPGTIVVPERSFSSRNGRLLSSRNGRRFLPRGRPFSRARRDSRPRGIVRRARGHLVVVHAESRRRADSDPARRRSARRTGPPVPRVRIARRRRRGDFRARRRYPSRRAAARKGGTRAIERPGQRVATQHERRGRRSKPSRRRRIRSRSQSQSQSRSRSRSQSRSRS